MNKKQLIARCKELGIDPSALNTNAELEAAIQAKEAELAKEPVKSEEVDQEVESSGETSSVETVRKTIEIDTASQENETVKAQVQDQAPEENSQEEETQEEDPAVYTDKRGRKFRFTEKAPKTLNVDGHPMTQQEILQSEEVISELVHGNNSFLTQIN